MFIKIEVSKGSNLKYEFCHKQNELILDRILHNSNVFPYNYGYIPNTLSLDGDPLDAILVVEYSLLPGILVECKVIGGIETDDENGIDDKIICVPIDKIDPLSKNINDLKDIDNNKLNNIKYFLTHYKDNENDKFINIGNFYNKECAENKIKKFTI